RSFGVFEETIYVYCPSNRGCDADDSSATGSLERPASTLERGLALAALVNATTIAVAGRGDGAAYEESIRITQPISVMGGYSPDFSERDPARFPTIVRSNTERTVLVFGNTPTVSLSGLTLAGNGPTLEDVLLARFSEGLQLDQVDIRVELPDEATPRPSRAVYGVNIQDSVVRMNGGTIDVTSDEARVEDLQSYGGFFAERSTVSLEDTQVVFRGSARGFGIIARTSDFTAQRIRVEVGVGFDPSLLDRSTSGVSCTSGPSCIVEDSTILGGRRALQLSRIADGVVRRNLIGTFGCVADTDSTASTLYFFSRACTGFQNIAGCEDEAALDLSNNVIFAQGQFAVAMDVGSSVLPPQVAHNSLIADGSTLSVAVLNTDYDRANFANNLLYAAPSTFSTCFMMSDTVD
ncbi:MAG: hypothetical protein AAF658_20170, partial [Myxococcota bacterium]